jgi:type I restriction enzyme R subunit
MKYKQDVNPDEAYFSLKTEQLSLAILQRNAPEIERLRDNICEYLNCLPTTINQVKAKQQILNDVLKPDFWIHISFEDAQMLGRELAPLMRYKLPEPRPTVTLDIDDVIQEAGTIEFGPLPSHMYVKTYLEKVEQRIKELADKHPTVMKIKKDEVLTEDDLKNLETTLDGPDLYITEKTLQKVFRQKGTLVQFIKTVLGLYKFPDPKTKIEDAFKTFMVEKNYLNADQVNFLRTIQTVFMKKHHIEYSDLFEPPFTNFGSTAPIPLFQDEDLKEIIQICTSLEGDIPLVSS